MPHAQDVVYLLRRPAELAGAWRGRRVGRGDNRGVMPRAATRIRREARTSEPGTSYMMFQDITVYKDFPQRPVVLEGKVCLRARQFVGGGSGAGL